MNRLFVALTVSCVLAAGTALFGQSTQPDNTRANKGDSNASATTADQQKMNKTDRQTAKQIRKAIVDDRALSTYAHNVKVIVRSGNVTLKGPVYSEDEKKTVESYASKVAGANNVNNQITVKGDSD